MIINRMTEIDIGFSSDKEISSPAQNSHDFAGEMNVHSDIKEYAPNGRYFSRVQSGMPGAPATSWECMGT